MAEASGIVEKITIIGKVDNKYTLNKTPKVFWVDSLDKES